MTSRINMAKMAVGLLLLAVTVSFAAAPEASVSASAGPVVVLDTTGLWRMHHTLKPPVIALDKGVTVMDLQWHHGKRILRRFDWARRETPAAAADWATADFDDTAWLRGPARMCCRSPMVSRLCMRGRFMVTDPSKAGDLKLDLGYRGGVIVYLNGTEVGRRDVERAARGKELLAKGYPADAFTPSGGWSGKWSRRLPAETEKEVSLRSRSAKVSIPSSRLREGVNVLAVEVVRAPYHKVIEEKKGQRGSRYCPYVAAFNTCQIDRIQLTASGSRGIVPNATRTKGFQIWNNSTLGADFDLDYGEPGDILPIRLVGARNGSFSGKVVVGSTDPIRGLVAKVGALAGGRGETIPASAVRIRYGIPWGIEAGVNGQRTIHHSRVAEFDCYARRPTQLGALAEVPLEEFPVRTVQPGGTDLKMPAQVEPVFGAVVPVWVTVDVPKTAPKGLYKGQLTIRAQGMPPRTVPVEVTVTDYTLPDPQDYRTMLELIQSPDTLAMEYKVDLWSDKHFELIARSMKLMSEAGVQILYVPLIGETNLGNAESMVRYVKTGEKSYDFDFSVMDRYLDLAAKHMGTPKVVCFVAWDIYLGGDGGGYKDTWSHNQRSVKERAKFIGKGPIITLIDRKTKTSEKGFLPPYDDPAAKVIWKKLFGELRTRMAKRQWQKQMMVGLMSDDWPTAAEKEFYKDVSDGLLWVSHSHVPVTRNSKGLKDGVVTTGATAQGNAKVNRVGFRVGYHSAVLTCTFADGDPPLGSYFGWRREDMGLYQPRYESRQPASRWRQIMELNVTGKQRGVARGGADIWSAIRDRNGRRVGNVAKRYPHSAWRNLDIPWCMFAPGPTGPVSTHYYEALREGVQECQARIVIEEALTDEASKKRLGEALVKQCEDLLLERTHFMLKAITHLQINNAWGHLTGPNPICRQSSVNGHRWFVSSGWQDRSERLYTLAGTVARKVGRK